MLKPEDFGKLTDEELDKEKLAAGAGSNYWEWAKAEQERRAREGIGPRKPTRDEQIQDAERVNALIRVSGPWTDEQLEELRNLGDGLAVGGTTMRELAQIRSNLELLQAIRKFDNTSTRLINTTNLLTRVVLGFTIGAVIVALVQLALVLWKEYKY